MKNKATPLLCLCVILAITFFAFSPSLNNDFTNWDESLNFLGNPDVQNFNAGQIRSIFTRTINGTYVPLTTLSFGVEYSLAKDNPFSYHLTNLIGHLCVTALVFVLARQLSLSLPAAAMAALLFGIHPVHVESVTWISARKDILMAFFFLLSFHFYIRYRRKSYERDYALSLGAGIFSLLAQPAGGSLVLGLWIYDWFARGRLDKTSLLNKIPFLIYTLPLLWISYRQALLKPAISPIQGIGERLWAFGFYLKKFVFPIKLLPLYEMPHPLSFSTSGFLAAIGFCLAFITFMVVLRKRRDILLTGGLFTVCLLSSMKYTHPEGMHFVADRYLYLPSVFLCLGLGFLAGKNVISSKRWVKTFSIVLCVLISSLLSAQTFRQTKVWKNSRRLWTHAINREPQNYMFYVNRGWSYAIKFQFDNALRDFETILEYHPYRARTYCDIGEIHLLNGKEQAALDAFNKALELDPNLAWGYYIRGNYFHSFNQYELALSDYNKAIGLAPETYYEAYRDRGLLYEQQGNTTAARADYQKAADLNPYYAEKFLEEEDVDEAEH